MAKTERAGMSSSQQARNKQLHKMIDQLEDQIDRLKNENDRLRDLIPQAWQAGQAWLMGSHKDFKQTHPTAREWMEQKGLI